MPKFTNCFINFTIFFRNHPNGVDIVDIEANTDAHSKSYIDPSIEKINESQNNSSIHSFVSHISDDDSIGFDVHNGVHSSNAIDENNTLQTNYSDDLELDSVANESSVLDLFQPVGNSR